MTTSLHKSRQQLVEVALGLLWRQWTLLGVPGQGDDLGAESRIVDPESLLLLTSELGRFDARLLDEVVNWLRQHGRFINIQRLKSLQQQHAFGNTRVLAAMAATLLENSRLAKWRAVELLAEAGADEEPLFRNAEDGLPLPVFGRCDPVFQRFGYSRGVQEVRRDASAPRVESPDLLLIKLRALFGVNARAEILAALLTTHSHHASGLARRTGYLPRSVQDVLNEMAFSGHVVAERPKGSREKFFSLRPGDWNFLITWSGAKFPQWVDWPVLFSLLQESLLALYETKPVSPLAAALRFRDIFDRHYPALSEAGLAGRFSSSMHESGLGFMEAFRRELTNF